MAGPSSTGSGDSDGGLFAVPTTLPPNSRHGKLYSPSKETELTFRQHLNSISVSGGHTAPPAGGLHLGTRSHPGAVSSQMQSDFFLPKPRKLRNRHLRKPLVVQVRAPTCGRGAGTGGGVTGSYRPLTYTWFLCGTSTTCTRDEVFWGFKSRVSQVRVCPRTLGASVTHPQPAEADDRVEGGPEARLPCAHSRECRRPRGSQPQSQGHSQPARGCACG